MPSVRSYVWRLLLKTTTDWNIPLESMRVRAEKSARLVKVPKGVVVTPARAAGVRAEWLEPGNAAPGKVMLYLHGGGYAIGSCATHRGLAARIAESCGARALVLDYRLAPEHPFPAALEDALAGYRWLVQEGISPQDILIAGDSAGGGLALATLVSLRDNGESLPGMAFCMSPWTDLEGTGESLRTRAKADPWVTHDALALLGRHYVGEHDPRLPLISPLFADLQGLPTTLIHVGTDEIILSDSTRFAERAKAAGVDVTLKVWEGMWHVFHCFAPYLPEANQAIEEVGRFVRTRWAEVGRSCGAPHAATPPTAAPRANDYLARANPWR